MSTFGDQIASLCLKKYESLKKTGKPLDFEWTVLSGIVLKDTKHTLSVVSLATGTKCLSGTELLDLKNWEVGSRLSDSHAEILARRAFLRYLYHEINLAASRDGSNVFELDDQRKINLRHGISFHFYCSQTPCGDCSIFPQFTAEIPSSFIGSTLKKRKIDEDSLAMEFDDVHRTGAKCVNTEIFKDSHLPGKDYHVVGPLRTKPGRGDRTLSLSCADKMAKWNAIGIQGALLSLLISPVRMESFVVGGGCPFSIEAMHRGICKRFGTENNGLLICQADQVFRHIKGPTRIQPCPSSIIWCAVVDRQLEISVDGRKQGVTKKKMRGNYLSITRRELFRTFLKTVDNIGSIEISQPKHPKKITYLHAKRASIEYQNAWKTLKSTTFRAWPEKPVVLQDFNL